MPIVSFTLTDDGVASFQNALACILKFSEDVSLAAWRDKASITATHAISFEAKSSVSAKFNSSQADNQWSISAHTLRRLMDHFGPKVELLDINTEGEGVLNLTCSTEKQYTKTDGILNMNLHTSIAVKMDDFDDIDVEDKHHIIINVKDFRAILQHACTMGGILSAQYSEPCKPLRFSYNDNGLFCQFVLMTVGAKKGSGTRKDGSRIRNNNGQTAQPTLSAMTSTASATTVEALPRLSNRAEPKPSQPGGLPSTARTAPIATSVNSGFEMRPPLAPPSTIRVEALYDEDSQWEPVNPEEDNSGFVQIEWDESLRPVRKFGLFD
ncbi:hypothetical protein SCUCBS95973_000857 [Sporothrix curviconia]|uniref:DNA repair protein rad9 n=1 Tax=Sporothrix curviconia TaxID=1260050 RepID=A0ABP0ATQ7_9PEZI